VLAPVATWGGGITSTRLYVDGDARPSLYLVEVYGVSSFLGDYGLGRTVRTFTLLPGEGTTIRLRTWTSSDETIKEASSIIDSQQRTAADRFKTQVLKENTDKRTQASKESWHVEAEASVSWGFGSASVSGGAAGEYQSGREEFGKQLKDAVREHANEASAKRELMVTSSSEQSVKTQDEEATERTIRNVNMRRTLNFVFRELNQEYATKVHLKEVRVGFSNGLPDTWREVAISGLRGLLQEVVVPAKVDAVAQAVLKLVGVVFDRADQPVPTLEVFTMGDDGMTWSKAPAALVDGAFPPPSETRFYRFKRGPLGQDEQANPVDGVLMQEASVVLRTDSVVVEALLGEADALDEYALRSQYVDVDGKALVNDRERLAHQLLNAIPDPLARAEAFAKMFNAPVKGEAD
jgi:hypothetical protein